MTEHVTGRDERGQVLVIVAAGLLVLIAMVGLVIDGGAAWTKQRDTQNGADAVAEAGAVVLAEALAGVTRTDADVALAVNDAIAANGLGPTDAYYTDIEARMITPAGGLAANEGQAAQVGAGSIPTNAAGVRSVGSQEFDTVLMQVVGISELTAVADATAVAGYIQALCPGEDDEACGVLPITFPVTMLSCDGSNDPAPVAPPTYWGLDQLYVVPLCKTGPGNVGWLDWTPPGGGASELADSIENPDNPYLTWPEWYFVAQTGNINSSQVENAINDTYSGEVVFLPQFDGTCDTEPLNSELAGCPPANVGGNGQNQWYHFAAVSSFQFCDSDIPECAAAGYDRGAYIQGNNKDECDTGNGATSCLVGFFKKTLFSGEIGPAAGPASATAVVGVQLFD